MFNLEKVFNLLMLYILSVVFLSWCTVMLYMYLYMIVNIHEFSLEYMFLAIISSAIYFSVLYFLFKLVKKGVEYCRQNIRFTVDLKNIIISIFAFLIVSIFMTGFYSVFYY